MFVKKDYIASGASKKKMKIDVKFCEKNIGSKKVMGVTFAIWISWKKFTVFLRF